MMKSYDVDCYFPMKTGCHVTLYQDAHVLPNHLSSIPFGSMERPDGLVHQPRYVQGPRNGIFSGEAATKIRIYDFFLVEKN